MGFADSLEQLACYLCQRRETKVALKQYVCVCTCESVCICMSTVGYNDTTGENTECSHLEGNVPSAVLYIFMQRIVCCICK